MASFELSDLTAQFRQSLGECRELYVSSGRLVASEYPDMLPNTEEHFIQLMDDLHRALLVKIFVTICEADRRWSKNEKKLGETLLVHLWDQQLQDDQLKAALKKMSERAMSLKWYALVRPFDQIAPLRNRVGDLETLVTRLANLIARADGPMKLSETALVRMIQNELHLHLHLRRIPIEQLTLLEPEDIEFRKVPAEVFENGIFEKLGGSDLLRFHICCPECEHGKDVPQPYLGQRVRCPKCEHDFDANWGALVVEKA